MLITTDQPRGLLTYSFFFQQFVITDPILGLVVDDVTQTVLDDHSGKQIPYPYFKATVRLLDCYNVAVLQLNVHNLNFPAARSPLSGLPQCSLGFALLLTIS